MDKEPLFDNEELFALLDGRKPPKGAAGSENRILQAFENAGTGKKRATIHLYDGISFWTGNDARTFQSKLKEIQAEVIELRINSPGGSVFEGVTIYNLLIAHPARVEVKVDGLAGSIASVIMLAGDEVEVAENAMVMIHNPTVVAWGESTELRTMADALDRIKDAILNTYVTRTGGNREELARMMNETTYFSADEAVKHGFADRKFSPIKAAAFWNPEDFPEMPENVRKLFGRGENPREEDGGEQEEDCGGTPQPRPAAGRSSHGEEGQATVGTVQDVHAARDLVAEMRRRHGL